MEKVRFGIIGVGNMGSVHAKRLLAGEVENGMLSAVCDLKQEKLDRIKALEGGDRVETFTDYKELLGTLTWLCDNEASGFVTGIVVPVDGGFSAYSGV